jgi:hypothetical protein
MEKDEMSAHDNTAKLPSKRNNASVLLVQKDAWTTKDECRWILGASYNGHFRQQFSIHQCLQ